MPQELQRGSAVLHGIRNDGTAINVGYTAFIDSAKVQHDWKLDEVPDETGFTANLTATDAKKEADITLVPKGSSRAASEAATVFLEPLQVIEFQHFKVSIFNGNWIYMGGSIELSTKTGKVSLKFRRYDDDSQMAALSSDVS